MDIIGSYVLMDVGRMMFGGIVTQILFAGLIVETEEALSFGIEEPKVAHFHSMRLLAFDGVVHNADRGSIVNVNGNGRLGVAKFFEDKSQNLGFLCIEEKSTKFSFSGRCSDQLKNRAGNVDGTIDDNR